MAEVKIEFDDRKARRFFNQIDKNMEKAEDGDRMFVSALAARIFRDIDQHFKDEMGPEGKWKDWSPSYEEHMEKIGRSGNKILQFSGDLRKATKPGKWRRHPKGIEWFNDAKTKDGFPYAFAHDNDTQSRSQLPRRSFMWISEGAFEDVSKIAAAFITRGR